jgi:hypothetical protein
MELQGKIRHHYRFTADLIKNLQEVIFANVGASAEVYIADKVYNHVQG